MSDTSITFHKKGEKNYKVLILSDLTSIIENND